MDLERIKLIWDFRGPDAQQIAAHHQKHLEEYALAKTLKDPICDIHRLSEAHAIAFLVVDKDVMKPVRDALKPHRGQLFSEK